MSQEYRSVVDDVEAAAAARGFSTLRVLLSLIDRYGVALVFLCVVVWGGWHAGGRLYDDFVIPMRDSHIKFLEKTTETQAESAEIAKETSEAVQAIRSVVEDGRKDDAIMKNFAADHFEITKETADAVQEIKNAVVPKKATGP